MKKIISNILNQIIPVMIGVYLGFALNNFGENRKLENQASIYKKILANEIKENLEAIKKVNPYHLELSKDFSELVKRNDLKKYFENYNFRGLRPGRVNNSAYETGIQTGIIQEFELSLIQSLNKLYASQRRYDTYNEMMISSFLGQKFPESEDEIRNMLMKIGLNMNDVLNFEKNLQQDYLELLENL